PGPARPPRHRHHTAARQAGDRTQDHPPGRAAQGPRGPSALAGTVADPDRRRGDARQPGGHGQRAGRGPGSVAGRPDVLLLPLHRAAPRAAQRRLRLPRPADRPRPPPALRGGRLMTTTAFRPPTRANRAVGPDGPQSGSRPPRRGLLPFVALLVLWQLFGTDDSTFFPRPSTWLPAVVEFAESGELATALAGTAVTFTVGLLLATAIGVVLGVVVGSVRFVDR